MQNNLSRTPEVRVGQPSDVSILYEKIIGEKSYYIVQAVPDTNAKTLFIVTAFIGKTGYKKEASQLINTKSPDVTAKTGSASASDNSISQDSEVVKKNRLKSNKKPIAIAIGIFMG